MQLITMDVDKTLENKTLQNGLVDNTKTGDIANGLSKLSEKEEDRNSELVENSKPLVPVQPDNGNGIEDAKVSESSQDVTEVLSTKDIESDILAEKQNGETTENKETEISQSDKGIHFIQENKYYSKEEHKENNTEPSEILEDSKELKIAAPEVSLDEKALDDNNEDISKDKEIYINDSKTLTTNDTPNIEEAIITGNSATTDESSKTDEIIIQQTENLDQPNSGVIDDIAFEDKNGDVSTEQETDINESKTVTNDTNSTDEAIVTEKNVTSEESSKADDLITLQIENTVDQPNTRTDKGDAESTVEGPQENETETKSTQYSLPEREVAMETATTTEAATNQVLHNDIDSKKDEAMDAATTNCGDMEKSDTTSESIKHGVFDKEESIDTDSSINNGLNHCEATEEIKKLNNSQNEDAMETDTSISNNTESIEIKNIVVPDGDSAMDTATPNNDEIKNPNAAEETIEKNISLVEEDAMVTEPTIADKVSYVESNKNSKITDPPELDVNMETTENGSILPKIELTNSDTNKFSIPDSAENIMEETSDAKHGSVENIDEEALLASPSHKTALTDNDNCVPTTKDMSVDSANCVQIENPDIDINYELPEKLSTANAISNDKIDSISDTGVKSTDDKNNKDENTSKEVEEQVKTRATSKLCGLSNTLDILSDDEEDMTEKLQPSIESDSKCIDIEDDDDVMLIDDDYSSKESKSDDQPMVAEQNEKIEDDSDVQKSDVFADIEEHKDESPPETQLSDKTDEVIDIPEDIEAEKIDIREKPIETVKVPKVQDMRPIIPPNFLKTLKTNVEKMNREELEEFCLLKIVEAVVDRTNLGDIKSRLKTMHQQMEEWKKKSAGLSKQNRDLQIVLKTVQEEQRKRTDGPITPLKITRSVGMQVYMAENLAFSSNRRKSHPPRVAKYPQAPTPSPKQNKPASASPNPQIPVPRLVPATNNSPAKNVRQSPQLQNSTISSNSGKTGSPMSNGLKNSPTTKPIEKRPFSAVQSNVTVDLTDDEPPPKVAATTRNAPQQSVRMVPQQQLMARPQFNQNSNSPRKVYIPINSQNPPVIRPGQTLMLKTVPPPGPRLRGQAPMVRIPQNVGPRAPRLSNVPRHPAPLPDVPKQQQPPNWKSLPPAPDLKISKVENGIVISWKIDGFTEVNFEEIASYQLYAYQETSSPPNTLLWKKIGDVKALPLPMACTLTQFMAGFKYYFAVRAVDVRSRIGPFSLPGSILLLNNK